MKKIFRFIRICLLWFLLLFLCIALYLYATDDTSSSPIPVFTNPSLAVYSAEKENVKPLGRTYYENGVRY
ncbi:MAG: hypothetical protein J6V06_03870, partial [Clostridia bacterium]|nr:hypothetical protein [Clostridia bacterium]